MKTIKVLGSGCKKCQQTAENIQQIADEMGQEITLEKVTDTAEIMGYGVMSTPGVVVEEQVLHAGGVPDKEKIKSMLSQ